MTLTLPITVTHRLATYSKKIEPLLLEILYWGILIQLLSHLLLPSGKQHTIYYLTVLLPWCILLPFRITKLLPKHLLIYSVVAFLVYSTSSALWSLNPMDNFYTALKQFFYIFSLLSTVYWVINHKENNTLLFKSIIVAALITGIYTLYQINIVDIFHITNNRLMGIAENPLNTALYFGIASLTSFYFFCTEKNRSIYAYGLLCVFFLTIVLLTKSRGPILYLMLSFILSMIVLKKRPSKQVLIICVLILAIITSCLLLYWENISTTMRLSNPSYRLELIAASFAQTKGHFLFGTGLDFNSILTLSNGKQYADSHNFIVEILRTGGLVGTALWAISFLYALFLGLSSQSKPVKLWTIWLIYGALHLFTDGKFLIHRPSSTWFAYWIPFAFLYFTQMKESKWQHWQRWNNLKRYLGWQYHRTSWHWLLYTLRNSFYGAVVYLQHNKTTNNKTKITLDVLILHRSLSSSSFTTLLKELNPLNVQEIYSPKRNIILKKKLFKKTHYKVPLSLYLYATYAKYIVDRYKPKIIITDANGSLYSPFLRLEMNAIGGKVIHIAHSMPISSYRKFSMMDYDYYYVYGQSSVDQLMSRKQLWGHTRCVLTGALNMKNQLSTVSLDTQSKSLVLLGSGPSFEKTPEIHHYYQMVTLWAKKHPEFILYFKPHPRSQLTLWKTLMAEQSQPSNIKTINTYFPLKNTKIAIAAYTNAVIDISLANIPVIWMADPNETDHFKIEHFFRPRVNDTEGLNNTISTILNQHNHYVEQTKAFSHYHLQRHKDVAKFMGSITKKIHQRKETFDYVKIGIVPNN